MKLNILVAGAATAVGLLLASGSAQADTINVNLGASSQNFTEYGLGPVFDFFDNQYGFYNLGQGDGTTVGGITTLTLSGNIAPGGTPGFTSGTYTFVTQYAAGAAPQAITSTTDPGSGADFFNYFSDPSAPTTFFDPSTSMTLNLDTSSGDYSEPLVSGGDFVNGTNFFFVFVGGNCGGAAVPSCTPGAVGLVNGATFFAPVTIQASFQGVIPTGPAVPEPSTWAMILLGFGGLGGLLRASRRRQALHAV